MDDADRANDILDRAMANRQSRPPDAPRARVIGRCCACAGPIEPARLRIMPYAVRCITCQMATETRR